MKRKTVLLAVLTLLLIGGAVYYFRDADFLQGVIGGKDIKEGVIEYDITYPKMDANNMMVQGLPDKAYLRFKNNNMSNDMSGMMGLISITYVSKKDAKSVNQTLTLINRKYASELTPDELKALNDSYVAKIEEGSTTQEIAGFKCKEAVVTLKSGETIKAFYTDDIGIEQPNWSNPYSQIEGVLMDFQMERYGIAMHLKAKQVLAKKVDDSVFEITDDHKKIPFAELEQILKELNPN